MSYDIISIGDAEMLTQAFQGVAMIFGGGSMEKLIKSGFTVGTMLISLRYVTNQEFPLRYGLVGISVYSMMFVPMETVTIEDVYTGQVRVVANVPLGVAMPMSVISTMGVKMTEMFETAFSTPAEASMLQYGYLNSLNTLIKLRKIGSGTTASDTALAGDLSKSINNYIENCVMFDLEIPMNGRTEVTEQRLLKAEDLWSAMKTTFINRDILVYLPSTPNGSQQNCETAYESINTYITGADFKAQWDQYMRGVLDITDPLAVPSDRIDVATQALGIAAIDSQIYMRNALLSSYLKDGPSAFIKRSGQEQLNLQWAGEQTMFNEISRPLMAFVEMFTIAVSPIVAFLSTLGPIGMVMMVRYVQMMIWIALWGPTMAVCNLYIAVVTSRIMEAMATQAVDNGSALSAMVMHDKIYQTLETWLSAGGMLASSVPALSLMLVYGGSIAATNLSGKMTSGASSAVNTKMNAPDPISVSAPLQMGSMSEMSANVGPKRSGMADTTYSASSTFGRASSSASDSLRSSSASASQALGAMQMSTQKSGAMSSNVQSVMDGISNTISSGSVSTQGSSRTTGSSAKMTSAETEAAGAGVSGVLNAGLGVGKAISPSQMGAAVTASLMSNTNSSASRATELGDAYQQAYSKVLSEGNQTSKTSGSSSQQSDQTYSGSEESRSASEQYLNQLQAVDQASEKFTQTSSLQDSAGKSLSMSYQDLGARLDRTGQLPALNEANKAIEQNMPPEQIKKRSEKAQYDINNSSASGMMGGSREALAGFLKLEKSDPVAAAKIINDMINPGSSGTGVDFKPSKFQENSRSVDEIVSPEMASGIRSKASGQDDDNDEGGGSNSATHSAAPAQMSSHPIQNQAQKASAGSAGHVDNKPKTDALTGTGGKSPKAAGSMPQMNAHNAQPSVSNAVDKALKSGTHDSPDAVADKIAQGGHISSDNLSGKAAKAFELEGANANENLVKPTKQVVSAGIDTVTASAKNMALAAYNGGKELDSMMGVDQPSKQPQKTSDNDLPPIAENLENKNK